MKKLFTLLCLVIIFSGNAQTFKVDTLLYNGPSSKYINLVILGDGYTAAQQSNFVSDATDLSNYLFGQSPWSNYLGYFNIFAIEVISTASGAKHPNTAGDCGSASPQVPTSNPANYLGSTFDYGGIHRLVVPANSSAISNVLSTNFPNYDQVLIIANSPYYGGSGGTYATSTTEANSSEITAHELGHSFAKLSDEYYAGDQYAAEKPNMTQQTNATLVKWKNWMNANGTGIYQHCCGGNSPSWYRPHQSCKMRYLGDDYCSVCKETMIEKIHSLVNVVVSYLPATSPVNSANQFIDFKLTTLMKPAPNSLHIEWKLDNVLTGTVNADSVRVDQNPLSLGSHTLTATVTDTTAMLRVNNHSTVHLSVVTWIINKTATGISITANDNKITCSLFPNPASEVLNISVEMEKPGRLSVQLVSAEGKLIRQIADDEPTADSYNHSLNISDFASGTYMVLFRLGDTVHSQVLIKQ